MGTMSTAIKRRHESTPMRWLYKNGYLGQKLKRRRILDYGCGYGADVKFLKRRGWDARGYDPVHYDKVRNIYIEYDVICCTYLFNTIQYRKTRANILNFVKTVLLRPDGVVYVTVRRDIKGSRFTTKGWQGNVKIPGKSIHKTSWFEIFEVRNG